jgi:hypothetical protein
MTIGTSLTLVEHRALAVPLVEFLADHGVAAWVESDDCGGVDPALAFSNGVRVMVRPEAAVQARELLVAWEAAEPLLPPDGAEILPFPDAP